MAEEGKACRVIVPDDQLSLAIGKEGQNARLAARLTGYKIDIKPESYQGEDDKGDRGRGTRPVTQLSFFLCGVAAGIAVLYLRRSRRNRRR